MTVLLLSVAIAVGVSFLCSLMEAALYTVSAPFVRSLIESGSSVGRILNRFKEDIDRPISAILILNTLAHTAGAAVAGAAAADVWGAESLFWFSIVFTLLILFLSELVPKVLGVTYSRPIAVLMAYPLAATILALYPLVFVSRLVSRRLRKEANVMAKAPEDEVRAMAAISAEEGSILEIEQELIHNVLRLNEITAGDIMTPRTVVLKKPGNQTVRDLAPEILAWSFSRIPVHPAGEEEELLGFVLRRDLFLSVARGEMDRKLSELVRPIRFVPKTMPGHVLLKEFIQARQHLFAVVDEWGGLAGVVTLEDVVEFIVGREIVDEIDVAVDMQEVARRLHKATMAKSASAKENGDAAESAAQEDGQG